jgi:hypothetical protein
MSLLALDQQPYELPFVVHFGPDDQLLAIRYSMSNSTLTQANYEVVYGAILTQPSIEAPTPAHFYLVTPEPPSFSLFILAALILSAIALAVRRG